MLPFPEVGIMKTSQRGFYAWPNIAQAGHSDNIISVASQKTPTKMFIPVFANFVGTSLPEK